MTGAEAAVVLAKAAAYDNRTVTEEAAIAWSQALPDIRLQDAIEAVVAHYARLEEWLRPAHLRRIVAQVRANRITGVPQPSFPAELPPACYNAALGEWRRRVGDGDRPTVQQVLESVQRLALTATPGSDSE